jgi:hypothetical protein
VDASCIKISYEPKKLNWRYYQPAYIFHPDHGYLVGDCFGMVFYEDSRGIDISSDEKPIRFKNAQEAKEYMDSWIASDGKAYVTCDAPLWGVASPEVLYQGVQRDLPSHLAAIAAE